VTSAPIVNWTTAYDAPHDSISVRARRDESGQHVIQLLAEARGVSITLDRPQAIEFISNLVRAWGMGFTVYADGGSRSESAR